ncbi:MAG TPA: ABC transporter ATP-binding protein [Candidatus Angelobacter sp.]|nr:ABC transporter ATP-binding protein [Candidatus Angelobacter sp.]
MTSAASDSRPVALAPANAAVLNLLGLSIDYVTERGQPVAALHEVSMELHSRRTLGVLGESGSGKSTLSRAILQLLPSSAKVVSGSIAFQQTKNLLSLTPQKMRAIRGAGIALISQEPALALNPVLTIGKQIMDVLRAHGSVSKQEAMQQTAAMLREVGFSEPDRLLQAYPHQLSGGQRQRAAIAQALICRPGLLIADEPLSALDTITQAEILEVLHKLKDELGLAMIFITQNAWAISDLADELVVLRNGSVVAVGKFEELAGSTDEYVRGLMFPEKSFQSEVSKVLPRAESASAPLVQVHQLSKKFVQRHVFSGKKFAVQALREISLDIPEGSTTAIIGRSGSGKSTLARCIAGFEQADEGGVLVQGVRVKGPQPDVQLIFQDAGTALNPSFTAEELIAEPMEIAGQGTANERRERVLSLIREVGLDPESARRRAGEFSGGQKQRLALARALAANPRLLILDESLSGLDLPLQAKMLKLLLDLQKSHGLSYLHICHDLNFIGLFAREVIVMDQGRVVERVTPAELQSSTEPATRALMEAGARLHAPGLEAVL